MRSLIRVCSSKVNALGAALAAAAVLTLSGCGGGDSVIAGGATVTGQFVDAKVVGLGYKCGTSTTLSGKTNTNGEFTCKTGESVAFYVGGIKLGSVASAQAMVTPLDLVGAGVTPADPRVANIVKFLMSVSSTAANSGTLTIAEAVDIAAATETIDFTVNASQDLTAVIGRVIPGATFFATDLAAKLHMSDSLNTLFAGAYSGTFAGSFSGTWSLTIDAKGGVNGTATDSTGGSGMVSGSMSTTMGTGSTYTFTGTGGGTPWTGTLNLNTREFKGTWADQATGNQGTFTGTGTAAAASAPVQATPTTPSTATNDVTFSTAFNGQTAVTAALSGGALQVSNAGGVNTHSGSWGAFQTAQITVNHYQSTGAEYLTVAAQGGNNMAYLNLASPRNCYVSGGTPTCASVNIAFDKAAGKITFTGTPMDNNMTLTGFLSFPPF